MREYLGADRIEGPLITAEGYGKAAYGELVEVHAADSVRLGQVLTTGEDLVIAELWPPPIDVLPSLSRLMKNGIGEGRTRADHPSWAAQLYASYARVQEIRAISVVIGETALTQVDRAYLEFGRQFESRFVAQAANQARSIAETLDLGWEILSLLLASELTRINEPDLQRHYSGKLQGRVSND